MANYERGVYEPRDEGRDGVRVFDGSEEDDDVEGSRLPLLIVLALLVLAMFAGVVWLAYTQGVARGRGETPVLTAANGPERVAPPQSQNIPRPGLHKTTAAIGNTCKRSCHVEHKNPIDSDGKIRSRMS